MLLLSLLSLIKGCHSGPSENAHRPAIWVLPEGLVRIWGNTSGLVHTPVYPSPAELAAANHEAGSCRSVCDALPPAGTLGQEPGPSWEREEGEGPTCARGAVSTEQSSRPSQEPLLISTLNLWGFWPLVPALLTNTANNSICFTACQTHAYTLGRPPTALGPAAASEA